MGDRRKLLDLAAIVAGIVVVFAASAFAQGLAKGKTPIETRVAGALAYCSELSGSFRVCRVRVNDDGDAEFQIQKNGTTVTKIDAGFWSNVVVGPEEFIAYRGDMDRDGAPEIIVVELESVSQGMGVSYATARIFDGRSVGSGRIPISIPIQEFGDGETFFFDPRTRTGRVLITYWAERDDLETDRTPGLYLIGKIFQYKSGKLSPVPSEPTLARRFLNSFAAERNNESFTDRRPRTWLRNPKTLKYVREPLFKIKPDRIRLGKITRYLEPEGSTPRIEIATDDGETIVARIGFTDEQGSSSIEIDGVGIWRTGYLYPNPRSGGFRFSAVAERLEGRRVRIETHDREGRSITRIWLRD